MRSHDKYGATHQYMPFHSRASDLLGMRAHFEYHATLPAAVHGNSNRTIPPTSTRRKDELAAGPRSWLCITETTAKSSETCRMRRRMPEEQLKQSKTPSLILARANAVAASKRGVASGTCCASSIRLPKEPDLASLWRCLDG